MDKWQALQNFWGGFSWDAYDETTVPDDAKFPFITYETQVDSIDNELLLSASLWDNNTSWERISKKADEIAHAIESITPAAIKINGGGLFITKGTPFATRMSEGGNDSIRRIYLNINAEFLTAE